MTPTGHVASRLCVKPIVDHIDDEWSKRADFETALFKRIDPRKVDLILSERGKVPRGFERIAYRDGVIL